MEFLYLLAGLILGALPAYLWARFQNSSQQTGLSKAEIEKDYVAKARYEDLQERLKTTEQELRNTEQQRHEILNESIVQKQRLISLKERLENQEKDLEKVREGLTLQFEQLAHRLFEEKSQQFKQRNAESIQQLLHPLKEDIKTFKEQIQSHHEGDVAQYARLKEQLESLAKLNQQMSTETRNLTNALKGDTKMQGNWGEMVLEKILERSGLRKDKEYSTQNSYQNEKGRNLRPDVVIHLPDDKKLIVDAKASLVAYERYCSSEDEAFRKKAAKEHCQSIRQHFKGLSAKNYHNIEELRTLDFVLLFVPIEGAFALALEQDPELFNDAFEANIVIVSPTTLLATARTVANIWQQEQQNTNALEIANRGGKLYDKFVGFVNDLTDVQKRVRQTQESLNQAFNKLNTGRGNLQWQAEQLRNLGAKANKNLKK